MLPHYSTGNIRRRWHKHESKLLFGVMQSFLNDLRQYDIEPFLLDYSDLGDFVMINLSMKLLLLAIL